MLSNVTPSGKRGSSTWASYVKNILFSYGFGHVWLNQGVGNEGHFIEIFKQRVYMAQQKWCADVNSFDKLRSYSQFKSQLNLEKYISVVENVNHRRFLSKLRCSCHVLKIETGRRRKLNIEDRVCDMCGDGYVEDEYHFVLICRFFEELRFKYIPVQYRSQPCIPKFNSLMSSSSSFDITGLSHFVYYAMKMRESIEF